MTLFQIIIVTCRDFQRNYLVRNGQKEPSKNGSLIKYNNFTKRLLDKVLAKLFDYIIAQKEDKNMNNLQIIAVGTLVSVVLIESLMMNIKLKMAMRKKKKIQYQAPKIEKGFIDFKTGKRVDIDPVTRKETFVD